MAYSDTDESSVGISSRSGSWQIDSGSSDNEGGVAPAAPKVPAVVGGRRRNPRRRAAKEAGSFRAPSELRSDDSLKVGKKKKKKGVAPVPKVILPAVERKRNTRKKPQVAAIERSSEVSGEEEEEEGEDSVAQMRAMLRLPTVLIQVRKYGMDIVDICDQMENLLLDEGNNDEMSRLKQKLNKLSEKVSRIRTGILDCF